jgi:hypothetical protein
MSRLRLLARRFRRRWLGAKYCTIETRSTHQFELASSIVEMRTFKCSKCGHQAFWHPLTGLTS